MSRDVRLLLFVELEPRLLELMRLLLELRLPFRSFLFQSVERHPGPPRLFTEVFRLPVLPVDPLLSVEHKCEPEESS